VPEPVLHDDWPRPRFFASPLSTSQHTGMQRWAVWDRVYNFQLIARGSKWEMTLLAMEMEAEWLAEDAWNAAAR
jgi:hypothetical protein